LRSEKFVKYLGRFGWHCEILSAYRGRAKEYEGKEDVKIHHTIRIDLDDMISKLVSVSRIVCTFIRRQVRRLKHKGCAGGNTSTQSNPVVVRGLGIGLHIQRWLLLPDRQAAWILLALPKAFWLSRKCDVIYSSLSPFSAHVLGLIVKKLTGKPWVADYRDEWSLNSEWNPPTRLHKWLGEKLDKACVKNADKVIYVTQAGTERFFGHFGGCREKFVTIPNGYDEKDITKFRGFDPPKDVFVMTSIGSFYGGRDVVPFLRATDQLVKDGIIEREKLNIQLIGGRNLDLVREVERLEIGDVVQIMPRIPQQEAFMALALSNVAVLIGSDMERMAMTTKVYEYAGMGKPILALVPEGPVRDFVTKCGGWCVYGTDEEGILETIRDIFERYKSGRLEIYHQPAFIKRYERCTLTQQLANCFDSRIK